MSAFRMAGCLIILLLAWSPSSAEDLYQALRDPSGSMGPAADFAPAMKKVRSSMKRFASARAWTHCQDQVAYGHGRNGNASILCELARIIEKRYAKRYPPRSSKSHPAEMHIFDLVFCLKRLDIECAKDSMSRLKSEDLGLTASDKTMIILMSTEAGRLTPPTRDAVEIAAKAGVSIYPIFLGSTTLSDEKRVKAFTEAARATGGKTYAAPDGPGLLQAMEEIVEHAGLSEERRPWRWPFGRS